MRLTGNKFIPGIRIEVKEDEPEDKKTGKVEILDKLSGLKISTTEIQNDNGENSRPPEAAEATEAAEGEADQEYSYESATESFETYTSFKKFPRKEEEEEILHGTDWESVNYTLEKLACSEDEITGLEVTDKYIIVQYYIEPGIDVYDRESKEFLFRLEGHEYGGQCVKASSVSGLLYTASMDYSLKSWSLEDKCLRDSSTDHCDYVQSIVVHALSEEDGDLVATGGRGDKAIFVYNSTKNGKLQRKQKLHGHAGWVIQMIILPKDSSEQGHRLLSGSEDATIRIWDLESGECLNVLEQDAGISCLLMSPRLGFEDKLVFFGDQDGKLSYLDLEDEDVLHLLPNILIGTGKYCRSSKYHDKAVDTAHLTDNGYLITGSSGSKYVKVWKITHQGSDLESTEVKELQILRDHTDYLSVIKVHGSTIYSSCSDGHIYMHTFPSEGAQPHYEMAVDAETESSTSVLLSRESRSMAVDPEQSTEICEGPKRCKTGKTGLVKSSSSFQVSFQLKPNVCSVDTKIKIPKRQEEAILEVDEEEWEPTKDSDLDSNSDSEYEIVYVTDSEDDSTE